MHGMLDGGKCWRKVWSIEREQGMSELAMVLDRVATSISLKRWDLNKDPNVAKKWRGQKVQLPVIT